MKKYFYSHLVKIDHLVTELDRLELSVDEKNHLIELVHTNMHHVVLNTILTDLSHKDKKTFLQHLLVENHELIWKHLKGKIAGVEEKLIKTISELEKEFIRDIKELDAASS